jgi:hypothetical protein
MPIGFEVDDDDIETIKSVEEMRDALIKVQGDLKQTQLKYLAERAEVKYKEKNMIKLAKHLNVMSRVLESKDKDLKKVTALIKSLCVLLYFIIFILVLIVVLSFFL